MLPDAPRPEWAGYFLVRPALPDEGIPAYPLAEAVLVFRATGGEAPADHVVTGLSMAEAAGLAGDHTGIRAGEGIATGGAVDPVRIAVLKSRVNHSIDMAWILMVGDRPAARVTDGRLLWLLRSGSLNIVFEPGSPTGICTRSNGPNSRRVPQRCWHGCGARRRPCCASSIPPGAGPPHPEPKPEQISEKNERERTLP